MNLTVINDFIESQQQNNDYEYTVNKSRSPIQQRVFNHLDSILCIHLIVEQIALFLVALLNDFLSSQILL